MSFTTGSTPYGHYDIDPQFQVDADNLVDWTRRKLGEPIVVVHMSASNIYSSFEEAVDEYSAMINSYQAKSVMTQLLGSPTGSTSGSELAFIDRNVEFTKRMAEPYGQEGGTNGRLPVYLASIMLQIGQQDYDLQQLLSGTGPFTGSVNVRVEPREIMYFSPISAYRFFGTTSAINFLQNEFQFDSFTPETVFYLLPIWEDVLRGMEFKQSNKVRRSNYGYQIRNNVLSIYPVPNDSFPLWIRYTAPPVMPGKETGNVVNLSNVPFGFLTYSKINSIGKRWIRRFAFCLAKETEGYLRRKMNTIPIPNGDLTLDGRELVDEARQEQDALRQELRDILEELTYDKLAKREADMAEDLKRALSEVPLGIYVFCLGDEVVG